MNSSVSIPHTGDVALQFASYFDPSWQPCLYILWQRLQEGHICVPKKDLVSEEMKTLFPDFDLNTVIEKDFISDGRQVRPVVELNGNLYLQRYFNYESIIVNKVKEMIAAPSQETEMDGRFIENNEVNWQKVAAAACLRSDFTIITGGPGTGKTTTVAAILKLLLSQNPDYKVALAAPTGKAAARMAESLMERVLEFEELRSLFLKMEPSTIHRLLGNIKGSIIFRHNAGNPLNDDIIIIDESSMIDVALFARLLDAVKPGTKLILLGDKNQLASVEAGSLFGDLCSIPEKPNVFSEDFVHSLMLPEGQKSMIAVTPTPAILADHIVELQKSYRFSASEGIGRLSSIVIEENAEGLDAFLREKDDVVEIDLKYDEKKFEEFILKFSGYMEEPDIATALKKLNDYKVLCALREGKFGFYEVNRRIENILESRNLIRRTEAFYLNRPVMITRNNYALGLYNGDTGIVRKGKDENLKVWFEINGELTGFSPALISNADTSFALTIHKSQGSEFGEILIILPDYEVPVLTKELVYTAITRARNHVLLQTNETTLRKAIHRSVKRGSGLKDRF